MCKMTLDVSAVYYFDDFIGGIVCFLCFIYLFHLFNSIYTRFENVKIVNIKAYFI